MHVECPGCGSRGPGLAAVGTRCRFCGGTYKLVGIPPAPTGGAAPGMVETMRRERRDAHEQFEQYRRSIFRMRNPGVLPTTDSLAQFWRNRADPEHDRLAARLTMATASLNNALVSLGLPPEI